jgi:lipopolysaccharide transport system ATP-binding protein
MAAISKLCSRAVLLNEGRVILDGPVIDVVNRYIAMGQDARGEAVWRDPREAPGSSRLRLHSVRVISDGEATSDVDIHRDVEVEIQYWNYVAGANVCVSFHIYHQSGACVLATGNPQSAHERGLFQATGTIPGNFLNNGTYSVSVFLIIDISNIEASVPEAVSFRAHDSGDSRSEFLGEMIGVVRPHLEWGRGEQIGDLETPMLEVNQ